PSPQGQDNGCIVGWMRSTTGAVPACGNGSIRCRQLFWIAALLRLADVQFDEERLAAIDTPASHDSCSERPVLGLTGLWRFAETAVGTACFNVCFRKFRGGTFDALRTDDFLRSGCSTSELRGAHRRHSVREI